MALYYDVMKNYLKPALLALLISTACAFAKTYECEWIASNSPFNYPGGVEITHVTTSVNGQFIHIVGRTGVGSSSSLFKTLDGGVTWFILRQK